MSYSGSIVILNKMRLRINIRLLFQRPIDVGEVGTHQVAILRQGTSRVDECQKQSLTTKVVESNVLAILIHHREVRNFVAFLRFR